MKLSKILSRQVELRTAAPLSPPKLLTDAIQRLDKRWPDTVTKVDEKDREALAIEFAERATRNDWAGVKPAALPTAASAAFDPALRERPELHPLRTFLYSEVAASTRSRLLGPMLSVYLETYEPRAAHTRSLAEGLSKRKSWQPTSRKQLLDAFPEILDPDEGARLLGQRMALSEMPYQMLRDGRYPAPHSEGLIDHAQPAFLNALRPGLESGDRKTYDRVLNWVAPEGEISARQRHGESVLDALLQPWRVSEPSEAMKKHLLDALVSSFGDPRLKSGGVWSAVNEQERQTFFRWLTGATLEAFLDIVSKAENGVDEQRMWSNRRSFWRGLYKDKKIDAAWVALSDNARRIAHGEASRANDDALLRFGRQTAKDGRAKTSILILQCGSKIVVEGSHSYKVHIFRQDAPGAPKLFQTHYDCEKIRLLADQGRGEAKAHQGEEWKNWVLERI